MLTANDIYVYTKDNPEMNVLLEGGLESSEDLISLAMRLTVNEFNTVIPVTSFEVSTFPNDSILLFGTLHHLANSEAERQLRNQVNFNAQGMTNTGIDDKFQQYNALALYYKQLFDVRVKEYKAFINTEQAWGESFSPYIGINPFVFRN
jgi:hypothetical protein